MKEHGGRAVSMEKVQRRLTMAEEKKALELGVAVSQVPAGDPPASTLTSPAQ